MSEKVADELSHFIRRYRIDKIFIAILCGMTLAQVIFMSTLDGIDSPFGGRVGGDYPAFYSAGKIVLSGDGKLLYSSERQSSEQEELFGIEDDGYLYFAYPPYVALLVSPLAFLDYKTSFILFSAITLLSLLFSLRILGSLLPSVRNSYLTMLGISVSFYPLWKSLFGGQNTALSLLCLCGFTASLIRGRDKCAGLCLGAWFFKPHFVLLLLLLTFAIGRWRVLLGFIFIAVIYFLLGAIITGVDWPLVWIREGVTPFMPLELQQNIFQSVTLFDTFQHLFGIGSSTAIFATLLVGLPLAAGLIWWWKKYFSDAPLLSIALTTPAFILLAPHALYYDIGILILPLLVLLDRKGKDFLLPFIAILLLSWLQVFSKTLPINPAFIILIIVGIYLLKDKALRAFSVYQS